MTYILSTTPRIETIDDEPGMAEYALSNKDYGKTICYLFLPQKDVGFIAKLFNAQAEKAWAEGFAAGKEYGSESAKWFSPEEPVNPYTIQEKEEPS